MPRHALNLTGQRFGRLVTIERAGLTRTHQLLWRCRCDCGELRNVVSASLRLGRTRSCGCLNREAVASRSRTHGGSSRPEYFIWTRAKDRFFRPSHNRYKDYGGRGITMCDWWRDSFANFFQDMGPRPSSDLTLDRIDNDGPYAPDNCRWSTRAEQRRNSRYLRWIEFRGTRMICADWAAQLGLDPSSLRERLRTWPIERALSQTKLSSWNRHRRA